VRFEPRKKEGVHLGKLPKLRRGEEVKANCMVKMGKERGEGKEKIKGPSNADMFEQRNRAEGRKRSIIEVMFNY